ncbi:MAG: hypothetical protein JRG75_01650, partial [Deltaproteobacteria bacterium]|nr:hypothetical protein [Deltaproteobacteria bacterium]
MSFLSNPHKSLVSLKADVIQNRALDLLIFAPVRHYAVFQWDILFAGENHRFTGLGYKPYDWVESLGKVFKLLTDNFPTLDIIIKPRPAEPYNHTIQLYSDAISTELSSRIRVIDAHEWLPHLVCGSDFVVTFSGSVLLETLLLQKPVIMCAGPTLSPSIVECEKAGAVILQSEWLEIHKALREKMPMLLQDTWKHTPASEAFVERFAYKWDGLASHR